MTVAGVFEDNGFRLITAFELAADTGIYGGGLGAGHGMGRGLGRGGQHATESNTQDSPFTEGGQFAAVLILDRSRTDAQIHRAAWLRGAVVVAGAIGLLCLTIAWSAMVRLIKARGRTRLLETEARHLRELGQAAAGLAHETRNPLGLVRGWTQRLAQN